MNLQQLNREKLNKHYGDFTDWMVESYRDGNSSGEISEMILRDTGIVYSPRSVQRVVGARIDLRSVKDSFRLAIDKGRVKWMLQEYNEKTKRVKISEALRFRLMAEAGFKCELCKNNDRLTIDHKKALTDGGTNDEENLQVLCWSCNIGKASLNNEKKPLKKFAS